MTPEPDDLLQTAADQIELLTAQNTVMHEALCTVMVGKQISAQVIAHEAINEYQRIYNEYKNKRAVKNV